MGGAYAPEGHVGEDSARYQEAGLGGVLQGGEGASPKPRESEPPILTAVRAAAAPY